MPDLFVDVLLPLPVANLFTYRVPENLVNQIAVGKRVIVPFGRQKIYSALIRKIHNFHIDPTKLKDVQSVPDEVPVANEKQFRLWEWIAKYYMCTEGEVMNAAFPSTLKLQSETRILAVDLTVTQEKELTENEKILIDALREKNELSIAEISSLINKSSVHQLLKKAFEKNLIILSEEIHQKFKPKKEAYLRFAAAYENDPAKEALFNELSQDARKAKQLDTLMIFLKYLLEDENRQAVKKSLLLRHEGISKSSLNTLTGNGIIVEFDVIVDRIPASSNKLASPLQLSKAQLESNESIRQSFNEHDVTLLHGVTSSGKTELYIHLIAEMLAAGKQVLYLLPEIALTTQLIVRLKKYFGDQVGVYHSRYSSNERVEIWNHVLSFSSSERINRSQIILGARSSLFLPFQNLGLIIVDEEHDQSFKQSDPAPRYNGRDSAIMLGGIHKAKVLLGSATPSMESYFNAKRKRYGLVRLNERHGGVQMPEIIIADVKEERRKKIMKSHFSSVLVKAMGDALREREQIILFQNRRGFSNFIECKNCNYIPHCRNCSVTLTYHKQSHVLKCHYCGFAENVPGSCPECGDHQLEVKGFGTEQIEEDVALIFPEARIARMDMDSTRTKTSFQKLINDFEERNIDILVGTQMVTKGLDFDHVTTIGIINADQLLNFPDFRSFERSFQLMAQVSGRSGRKSKRGKVIIQSQQPNHWVINDVVHNNYEAFYERDLLEREKFGYPPHSRLIEINLRHKENEIVHEAAQTFADLLRKKIGNRVLGPHLPLVSRIRNLFYRNIIIKIERSISPAEIKSAIDECRKDFFSNRGNHPVQMIIDVDPL